MIWKETSSRFDQQSLKYNGKHELLWQIPSYIPVYTGWNRTVFEKSFIAISPYLCETNVDIWLNQQLEEVLIFIFHFISFHPIRGEGDKCYGKA